MFRRISLFALLGAAACAGSKASPPADEDLAPRMFDADQIRAAFPQGAELRFRFEAKDAPAFVERWTWVVSTSSIAVIESEKLSEDGTPLGPKERSTSTWAELMSHQNFPRDKIVIEDVEIDAAIGRKKCRRYEVATTDEKGEPAKRVLYFAADLPGPPVRFETWRAGERVFAAEMIERKIP